MATIITSLLIGLTAGAFGGLIGIGGGLIMIPLMVEVLKLTQHKAHGTSLVALVFTGIGGATTYALHSAVDFTAAILLALTAVFTAPLGARYCNALVEKKLRKYFGIFLIFCSILLILKPYLADFISIAPGHIKTAVLLITGAATGFLSGMMGVGGGTIMVPVMVILIGFSQHTAQGTSLLVMVPAGAIGAFTHWKMGNVEKSILWGLIPGIILGTYLGGNFAYLFSDNILRLIFTVVILWMGIRYIKAPVPE
ncbi:MAG: permease [Smithella sp. SDB]|nr:MAG: permease [Smithella sp. SDB]